MEVARDQRVLGTTYLVSVFSASWCEPMMFFVTGISSTEVGSLPGLHERMKEYLWSLLGAVAESWDYWEITRRCYISGSDLPFSISLDVRRQRSSVRTVPAGSSWVFSKWGTQDAEYRPRHFSHFRVDDAWNSVALPSRSWNGFQRATTGPANDCFRAPLELSGWWCFKSLLFHAGEMKLLHVFQTYHHIYCPLMILKSNTRAT